MPHGEEGETASNPDMSAGRAALSVNKDQKNFTCSPGNKMHRKLWGKKTTQKQFISPNSKPMQTQKYNGEKTASSISGAGKTEQLCVKE